MKRYYGKNDIDTKKNGMKWADTKVKRKILSYRLLC